MSYQRSYDEGEALGCPMCACAEPHVCPFLIADEAPEPTRSWVLDHLRHNLDDRPFRAAAELLDDNGQLKI